ncbi:LOW QUALITY PROTEIN: hypothetical protein QYF61_004892 [Mycteria americana]|uniref:Integrase catalytic domain-containing protein n=1 Tax=Mycteria americana TaxID=33587 RepID=A0AAN7MLQ4_MYCAM|nr:LOW QUALITY PROTEIN: hypothetical protein QYF61_004892 [Mycteria americana]
MAQKAMIQKWYAYLEGASQLLPLRAGPVKASKLQQPVNPDPVLLGQPYKPSPIKEVPELTAGSDTRGMWFTDASAHPWEVGHKKVWRAGDWHQLLETGRSQPLKVGWVKGHARNGRPTAKWSQRADHLAQIKIAKRKIGDGWLNGCTLSEATQGKQISIMDSDPEVVQRPWEYVKQSLLLVHNAELKADQPNQAPAQHIRQGKALWSTWHIGYVGPLRTSHGKKYIFVGVELASGLTMATAVSTATRDQMVQALRKWFSILPTPECIQSDNESHFTATAVQDWARGEGTKWVFHTPYYLQASSIVERTNGLIKRRADVSHHNWDI